MLKNRSENFIREIQPSEEMLTLCDYFLEWFHNNNELHYPGTVGSDGHTDPTVKISTDFNLKDTKDPKVLFKYTKYLTQLHRMVDNYLGEIRLPLEGYKLRAGQGGANLQWYKPGEGFFQWHSERSPGSHFNDRWLVFMTYLDTPTEGGGTEFFYQDTIIKAEKGKTVLWPSEYTHAHRGQVCPHDHKHILTGWLYPHK